MLSGLGTGSTRPAMRYFDFLYANRRFLAFGLLMTFASSFGQTFYVSLFGAELRTEFGLSNTAFGSIFSGATIASAILLVFLGRLIDRVDLRLYTACAVAALLAAMAGVALAPGLWAFVPALFLLRMSGQGLMPHIANTAMARYFEADRGKAVSVTGLGMPTGEAILPMVAVALLAATDWRTAWFAIAGVFALAMVAGVPALLKGQGARHAAWQARMAENAARPGGGPRAFTAREVLRDARYLSVTALFLSYPFIGTGLFFHQVWIAQDRGWALETMALGFTLFAVAKVATALTIGPVVDRMGATRLFPVITVPMLAVLGVLAGFDGWYVPLAYFTLFGLGSGMLQPLMSGFLAENFGVANYGSIRAVSSAIMVLSTAAAPASFGFLFDHGVSVPALAAGASVYVAAAGILAWAVPRGRTRPEVV